MLNVGEYQTLKVARITDHGLYLADEDGNEVLLPNRYVALDDKEGDEIEVFVYHDSESRLIATREHPLVTVGHVACLKAVDRNVHGVFFDWGITAKDLFMPNANMAAQVEIGRSYVVFAYLDKMSERMVATAKMNAFVNNSTIAVREKEPVEILVARRTETGYRVIVNDRNWGVVYDNQIFSPIRIGDRLQAYVRRITEDNRIDIGLTQEGFDEVKNAAGKLEELLRAGGGELPVSDRSLPEEIARIAKMSKKSFKRALGHLMKEGIAATDGNRIKLL